MTDVNTEGSKTSASIFATTLRREPEEVDGDAVLPGHASQPRLSHSGSRSHRHRSAGISCGSEPGPASEPEDLRAGKIRTRVQEIAHIAPKRSYAEAQLGYILTCHLSIQGSTVWAHSHNGIDFINGLFPNNLPEEQYLNHDRISRVNLLDVGASSTYAITRKTNLFVGCGHSINGTNTHLRSIVLSAGVTRTFVGRSREERASVLPSAESNRALVHLR